MSDRDPALEPFDALIGTWATEATHPRVDAVVPGTVTFEWLEGGHFIVQRSHNEHQLFPDAICVIGAPEAGDRLVMEYFDSRGVRRTYGIALGDGVIEPNAAPAGAGRIAFAVAGLDALLERLAAQGIDHEPIETYANGVRHVNVPDPDGNTIAVAEPPDAASASPRSTRTGPSS
jgi:catechol 2,3-dioxygenase-like lactoylglutathione lyase family enzyme